MNPRSSTKFISKGKIFRNQEHPLAAPVNFLLSGCSGKVAWHLSAVDASPTPSASTSRRAIHRRPAHRWRFLCRSFPLRCCLMLARFGARTRRGINWAPHARASSQLVFMMNEQR
ncbi:hypothetical protein GQ55_4G280600 [Panicum hallii var. hallii]|uniref:Uncharacterized protein n=1 Tax=Panicum hallii var. hallii TaxID=1504633 RepID=A0A2T7E0Z5_9POAL|nr:hypothetical protein GQ55_4G280600 [Panicum hallii var. hallii]